MDIVIRDEVRQWMRLQMNGKVAYYTDAPDVEDALSLLDIDPKPENVLDVGSGIGRASVYLNKRLGWNETTFWLLVGWNPLIVDGVSNKNTSGINRTATNDISATYL